MQDANPYRAPVALVDDVASTPLPIHTATRWRRLFNYLVDRITLLLFWGVVAFAGALIGGEAVIDWLEGLKYWQEYLLGIPVYLAYFTLMEGTFGVTLGKCCTGTFVVDENGHRIGYRRAFLRSLCRLIPFDAFSVLMSDDHVIRAWHDSLTRSYVVLRRPTGDVAPVASAQA